MQIKLNLKGNFKLVPDGERVLTITKAECTPSGKPDKMKVTFQDVEGGFINSQYEFSNDKALFAMSTLCSIVLELEDGDEFDTKDASKMVGKKVLCEVVHTQGTKANDKGEFPTFANVKKVLKLIEEDKDESPRNTIINDLD